MKIKPLGKNIPATVIAVAKAGLRRYIARQIKGRKTEAITTPIPESLFNDLWILIMNTQGVEPEVSILPSSIKNVICTNTSSIYGVNLTADNESGTFSIQGNKYYYGASLVSEHAISLGALNTYPLYTARQMCARLSFTLCPLTNPIKNVRVISASIPQRWIKTIAETPELQERQELHERVIVTTYTESSYTTQTIDINHTLADKIRAETTVVSTNWESLTYTVFGVSITLDISDVKVAYLKNKEAGTTAATYNTTTQRTNGESITGVVTVLEKQGDGTTPESKDVVIVTAYIYKDFIYNVSTKDAGYIGNVMGAIPDGAAQQISVSSYNPIQATSSPTETKRDNNYVLAQDGITSTGSSSLSTRTNSAGPTYLPSSFVLANDEYTSLIFSAPYRFYNTYSQSESGTYTNGYERYIDRSSASTGTTLAAQFESTVSYRVALNGVEESAYTAEYSTVGAITTSSGTSIGIPDDSTGGYLGTTTTSEYTPLSSVNIVQTVQAANETGKGVTPVMRSSYDHTYGISQGAAVGAALNAIPLYTEIGLTAIITTINNTVGDTQLAIRGKKLALKGATINVGYNKLTSSLTSASNDSVSREATFYGSNVPSGAAKATRYSTTTVTYRYQATSTYIPQITLLADAELPGVIPVLLLAPISVTNTQQPLIYAARALDAVDNVFYAIVRARQGDFTLFSDISDSIANTGNDTTKALFAKAYAEAARFKAWIDSQTEPLIFSTELDTRLLALIEACFLVEYASLKPKGIKEYSLLKQAFNNGSSNVLYVVPLYVTPI